MSRIEEIRNRVKWWQEARFGMFLHWGIYTIPACGEWVMSDGPYKSRSEDMATYKIGYNAPIFSPTGGVKMSVEDLAILARKLIEEFPQFYHLFSQKEFTHNGIKQGNRNPLLYSMEFADGLKTGHTDEAGFCLTASAIKDGRRLISVMSGMKSNKERSEEAEKLMNYGFREFDNYVFWIPFVIYFTQYCKHGIVLSYVKLAFEKNN